MGQAKATPVRILLVDDNLDHAHLALRALKGEPGWSVDTVRMGGECLDRATEDAYDLVLLDYRLPDMTGLDVLRVLRARAPGLAVFLMTSQGSEEVAMQALSMGATTYVVKNADFGRRLAYEVRQWALDTRGAEA